MPSWHQINNPCNSYSNRISSFRLWSNTCKKFSHPTIQLSVSMFLASILSNSNRISCYRRQSLQAKAIKLWDRLLWMLVIARQTRNSYKMAHCFLGWVPIDEKLCYPLPRICHRMRVSRLALSAKINSYSDIRRRPSMKISRKLIPTIAIFRGIEIKSNL